MPPAIVILYFLKLKRQPLEVPSTFLWRKSIEYLTVNSLWQRLRKNLLLLLQLLVIAALAAAVLRPGWQSKQLSGGRYIFLIDTSASMSATDVAPTRLAEAKRRIGELIGSMSAGDKAMLISFSDTAKVEQSYTDNARDLRRALDEVRPTSRSTSLDEALQLAAGLANPGRSATEYTDAQVAEPLPAKLFIFSDGRFADVRGFSLGNLEPVFIPIGAAQAANVGIVGFSLERNDQRPDQMQAFARLENHSAEPAKVSLELRLDGKLVDARDVKIAADSFSGEVFPLGSIEQGVLHLTLTPADFLAADNEAWAVINPARRAKVLFVTPGNNSLRHALTVGAAQLWADVHDEKPAYLATPEYRKLAAGGLDLVIYDRCRPEEMPQANTLFIGELPPGKHWSSDPAVTAAQIIDTARDHPLMQFVELGDVDVLESRALHPPTGATRLIESSKGTLLALAPRDSFEDAVLGFELVHTDETGATFANTNWPIKLSFPLFVSNVLQYFGGNRQTATADNFHPGQAVTLRLDAAGPITVRRPDGTVLQIPKEQGSRLSFSGTDELGIYEIQAAGQTIKRIAVNLFDANESEIRPRPDGTLKIGYVDVHGQSRWEPGRREIWRILLLLALGGLLLEWYIYNRRVYL